MKTLRNQKFTNEQLCWTPFVKAFEFFSVCFRKKILAKSSDDKKRTTLRPSKPQRWLMGCARVNATDLAKDKLKYKFMNFQER